MKWIKTYRIFESVDDIKIIKDILLELEDNDFEIEYKLKRSGYLEIIITIDTDDDNGGLMGFEFIWRQVKDVVFRLLDYYYTEHDLPEITNNIIDSKYWSPRISKYWSSRDVKRSYLKSVKDSSPFRFFGRIRNGFMAEEREIEFGIGFTSEDDFNNAIDKNRSLGDYTIFEKLRFLIKVN